jgi:hypothetical protein
MAGNVDLVRLRDDIQSGIDKAGVLSLTERCDNLLMWGHYASSDTGICLEFAAFDVVTSFEKGFFGRAQPVVYSDKRRVFDPNAAEDDNVRLAIRSKSCDWAYELEWRIIEQHLSKITFPFLPELLTGVIFGCRISESDNNQIRTWATEGNPDVKFYRAELNEQEWKVDIISA